MRRTFVFDQEKCMACNACTVACKNWNQVNPGPVRWRKQYTHETDEGFFPMAMSCNHCEEPACLTACAVEAISKRSSDGVVYIDRDKCIGLQACISACPFAEPKIAGDQQEPVQYNGWQIKHPMQKCDFCMDRIDKGQKPTCVEACPSLALDSGDYDEMMDKYAGFGITLEPLTKAAFPYAYEGTNDTTQPSFLIHKRGSQVIIKSKA